jgi:hypothetical protein
MTSIVAALLGFVGGLVVAHVAAVLHRRNWQLQEAMGAYARLFAAGDEACRMMTSLCLWADNLDGKLGPEGTVQTVRKTRPEIGEEYERLMRDHGRFRSQYDLEVRHLLKQCWMLEREPEIRQSIEAIEHRYSEAAVGLVLRFDKLQDRRKASMQQEIDKKCLPDQVHEDFNTLRRAVARRYFHKSPTEGSSSAAKP